jgi:2-oxoisovalerate dehydrogenase E1 component
MRFERKDLGNDKLIELYRNLLLRLLRKNAVLLRRGRIDKWFSGIGQEAISVGATMLQPDEWIMPFREFGGVHFPRLASVNCYTVAG